MRFREEIRSLMREKGRMLATLANAQARRRLSEALEGLSVDADMRALEGVREHIARLATESTLDREIGGDDGTRRRLRAIRDEVAPRGGAPRARGAEAGPAAARAVGRGRGGGGGRGGRRTGSGCGRLTPASAQFQDGSLLAGRPVRRSGPGRENGTTLVERNWLSFSTRVGWRRISGGAMSHESGCALRALATSRVARIELCTHGTVHLTLGALTLRLTPDQLQDLAGALETAVARIGVVGGRESARLLC